MQNEIIINAELGETRVALLENNQFAELHIERGRDKSVVGNVVKGKVSRVLPGMQAAFVDIGLEKAAFLYVGDYFESVLETGETDGEPGSRRGGKGGGGRGRGRSAPPRIDTVLREGQEIIVQIAKEPIGTKGARITSSISIPGRHLVLTPWSRRVGVSRRIGSDKERRRLREIVERLRPKNLGFIIRTAGDGVREADLQADIRYLATVWAAIQQRHAENSAPALLYSEHDLPLRIVRDVAGHDTKRIVTDDKPVFEAIKGFVDRFVADPKPTVEHYEDGLPIFDRFDLETQIHANLERKVWLKSGGSLVIDKSEALTAIDVNTGRFVGKRDLEETVFKTNLEAVQEVVNQLRFRNLGGLIIIDLIDMESAGNREKVYRALQEALRADKARTNILKISELGLVEMTRKRTRENLVQTLCEPCGYCEGRSYILSRESVAFRVLREVRKHLSQLKGRPIAISVNPHVAEELLTRSKDALAALSEEIGKDIEVRARPSIHQEQYELSVLEPGPTAVLDLPWIQDTHPDTRPKEKAKDSSKDKDLNKDQNKDKSKDSDEEGESKRGGRRRSTRGRGRSKDDEETKSEKGEEADGSETEKKPAARKSRARRPKTNADDDGPSESPDAKGTQSADAGDSGAETSRSRRGRRTGGAAATAATAGKFETMSLDDDDYAGNGGSGGAESESGGSSRDRGRRKSKTAAESTEDKAETTTDSEKRPRTRARRPRRASTDSKESGAAASSTAEDSSPKPPAEPRGRTRSKKPVSDAAAAAAIYERLDSFDADAEAPKPKKAPARKRAARKTPEADAPEAPKETAPKASEAPDSTAAAPVDRKSDPTGGETAGGDKS